MKFQFSLRPTKVIPPDVHMGLDFSIVAKYPVTYTWGTNTTGQLGNNSVTAQSTPIVIGGATKTFCHVNGGYQTSYGLTVGGRLWSWGNAASGGAGTNSITNRSTPVSVCGAIKTFCDITGGGISTGIAGGALTSGGRGWMWGYNPNGQLGDNSITNRSTPVAILGATKTFCDISAGDTHTQAIDKNGRLWGWGLNTNGRIGDNTNVSKRTPVSVLGANKTFCQVSAGSDFACAIDRNGRVWCWGANASGQLGNNTVTERRTPTPIAGALKTFCNITAGAAYVLAIDNRGISWAWGINTGGELGITVAGAGTSRSTPVRVSTRVNRTFCTIQAANNTSIAADNYGNVWTWGATADRLGLVTSQFTPVSIGGSNLTRTFCKVAYDGEYTGAIYGGCGLQSTGRIWCWGSPSFGRLGNNQTATAALTPVSILGANKTFCAVNSGVNFNVAISRQGRLWSWGVNNTGQLGDNTVVSKLTPVSVGGAAKTFCTLSTGFNQTLAIDRNGRIWGWGVNSNGNLGDNTITNKSTPVSIGGAAKTFCKIAAGLTQSFGITQTGKLWAWGRGNSGGLGTNALNNRSTPVSVAGANKTFCFVQARAFNDGGCALDKNGSIWCWGENLVGQLGTNSTTSYSTPVKVSGANKTFCDIAMYMDSSFAIDKYGILWSWGNNVNGILGTGSKQCFSTPVKVFGTTKTFCEIYSKYQGVAAVDKNGIIWCWGVQTNYVGQLGNNAFTYTPQRVWRLGGTYLMNT